MIQTYRARYRLDMGLAWREPGELVPEAVTWFRLDAYLHTGRVVEAEVEPEEFDEAIARFCPELAGQIYELSGLPDKPLMPVQTVPVARKAARSNRGA